MPNDILFFSCLLDEIPLVATSLFIAIKLRLSSFIKALRPAKCPIRLFAE